MKKIKKEKLEKKIEGNSLERTMKTCHPTLMHASPNNLIMLFTVFQE